jgi:hypothetical protein
MSADIILVHDDPRFIEEAALALRTAGHDVSTFQDPLDALNAIEAAPRFENSGHTRVVCSRTTEWPGVIQYSANEAARDQSAIYRRAPKRRTHQGGGRIRSRADRHTRAGGSGRPTGGIELTLQYPGLTLDVCAEQN